FRLRLRSPRLTYCCALSNPPPPTPTLFPYTTLFRSRTAQKGYRTESTQRARRCSSEGPDFRCRGEDHCFHRCGEDTTKPPSDRRRHASWGCRGPCQLVRIVSTKTSASKGARSSGPSPRPTSLTGTPSSRWTCTMMPPLAVPSSLVSAIPVTLTTSPNTRAWRRPFCPVVASNTKRTSSTWDFFSTTRLTLPSSSIRPALVCRRPAVSMMTVSVPSSVARATASKATLAGSAPSSLATTGAPTRLPQVCSCSVAAARKVSAAPNTTLRPSPTRTRASLPVVVVLPVPLTPTTMTTAGRSPCGSVRTR